MTPDELKRSLEVLRNRLGYLMEPESGQIIDEAKAMITKTFQRHELDSKSGRPPNPWGYSINFGRPLRFIEAKVKDIGLNADLVSRIQFMGNPGTLHRIELTIRIWAREKSIAIRDCLDSEEIKTEFDKNGRRVMVRFHIDKANPGQPGPKFHLQFGGKPQDDELAWIHKSIDVPRFPHPLMDVVLATDLVTANFFGEQYEKTIRDPTWRGVLRRSQTEFWQPFSEKLSNILNPDKPDVSFFE